ncbi:target of Sbf [Exophiala xenobiotica]|uniref:glucan endo-1,3-beta-D-glucosidase n=1 Tax=Lithohypha guttulata TaxID=1690604 RepID=A0ABR0K9M5_9EURO|nr:target of Sbf [Lithohypha guttulata]KAK5319308.1 target of Sbf [Exophiala xenobiotica]
MKYKVTITALLTASASTVLGDAQLIKGNWYDSAVERIMFTNWDQVGTYNKVADMSNGQCVMEQVAFNGSMSPLDGEVSWHFRGPMHLKQFAFYTPGNNRAKRGIKPSSSERRHVHRRQARAVGDWVTVTMDDQIVSWPNEYAGPASATPAPTSSSVDAPLAPMPSSNIQAHVPSAPTAEKNPSVPAVNAGAGNWGRQAYYNADIATADGLVFLNNMGGQGSGVFDYQMGNSLSYMAADTKSGSASPQVLANTMIEDNSEVIIYSDKPCERNDCGAYRPGTVAYHGFDGSSKLFLLEFDMPLSGKTGFNMDMPATWMLNANIPRTQQYGDCSCWASGCGEWDVFEVLDSGNTRAISAIHAGATSGTETHYFDRPVDQTIKAAVIFDSDHLTGQVVVLSDDTTFDAVIADKVVAMYGYKSPASSPQVGNARIAGHGGSAGAVEKLTSVFKLGSG